MCNNLTFKFSDEQVHIIIWYDDQNKNLGFKLNGQQISTQSWHVSMTYGLMT